MSFVVPEVTNLITNILLIDSITPDIKMVCDSVNDTTLPIIYSTNCLRSDLLTILTNITITRIGIFYSEGQKLFLNNEVFLSDDNVEFMIEIIKQFNIKNVDYISCHSLNDSFRNYYNKLTETGVIVGASNDQVGNIQYGGNWILEINR